MGNHIEVDACSNLTSGTKPADFTMVRLCEYGKIVKKLTTH
jgi:hypothetical protein